MENTQTFGERLKIFRKEKRFNTQASFAEKCEIDRGLIAMWESSASKPSGDKMNKITKAFPDVNPDWLLNGTLPMILGNSQGGSNNGDDLGDLDPVELLKANRELLAKVASLQEELLVVYRNMTKVIAR